jgi:hypothetical protein
MEKCRRLTFEEWRKRGWWQRMLEWVFYRLRRLF